MRSSRAATEIASGTREQAEGVSRITGAVQRIARSAEEGAAGIGRLEGASRSIREHSARMRALVERYRTAVLGAVALALLPAAARAEAIPARLSAPPVEVVDLELAHVRLVALEVRAEHVRVVVP